MKLITVLLSLSSIVVTILGQQHQFSIPGATFSSNLFSHQQSAGGQGSQYQLPVPQGFNSFGQGFGQNIGQGFGQSVGQTYGQGIAQGFGQGIAQGFGQGIGQGFGQNFGQYSQGPQIQSAPGINYGQSPSASGFQWPSSSGLSSGIGSQFQQFPSYQQNVSPYQAQAQAQPQAQAGPQLAWNSQISHGTPGSGIQTNGALQSAASPSWAALSAQQYGASGNGISLPRSPVIPQQHSLFQNYLRQTPQQSPAPQYNNAQHQIPRFDSNSNPFQNASPFSQFQRFVAAPQQQSAPQQSAPAPPQYQPQPAPVPRPAPAPVQAPPQQNYAQTQPQINQNKPAFEPALVHYASIGPELKGDYKFGYQTGEKGSFREESRLPDGTVQGQYGYIDPNGKQQIVKYIAGKEGFKVLGNDEQPSAPQQRSAPQQYASAPAPAPARAQSYNPNDNPAFSSFVGNRQTQ